MALTRSILADNSPYYEAGLKKKLLKNEKWYLAMYLNGWQRIQKIEVVIKHPLCNAGNF
jgi:hypothetical protein